MSSGASAAGVACAPGSAHPATPVPRRRAGDSVLVMGCCGALQPRRSVAGASDACKPLPFRVMSLISRTRRRAAELHVHAGYRHDVHGAAPPCALRTARRGLSRRDSPPSGQDHDSNRLLGLAIQALEGGLLSRRPAHARVVRALRRDVRHGRDQQQLLPAARGADVPQLARARALPASCSRSRRAVTSRT